MNDDLDTLSSFRPETTGPTDVLVTEGRNALMTAIDSEPHAPLAPRRRLIGRRRVRVALVFATALVAVGSVAAAAGLIPDDVEQSLGLASSVDPAFTPDVDQAAKQASAELPGGGTVELWIAPNAGGGSCAYLRRLDADGTPVDGHGVACDASIDGGHKMAGVSASTGSGGGSAAMLSDGGLSAHVEWGDDRPLTLYGQAPEGAAEVAVKQVDGTVTTVTVDTDGWWVVALPTGENANSLKSVEARTAAGTSLAIVPVEFPVAGRMPGGTIENRVGPGSGSQQRVD